MDAKQRLAEINRAREKARLRYPEEVAWLEAWKKEFPNGSGHLHPRGKPFREPTGVTADKMQSIRDFERRRKK
jgi:hypothetical protein